MQGKVIKFNLVGAICILIAFIVIVSGIIISAINGKDNSSTKKHSDNTGKIDREESKEQIEEDYSKEYHEVVLIGNEEHPVVLKKYKSDLGYKMKYDIESFYIETENKNSEVDEYKSQFTDKISIKVSKSSDEFMEKTQNIIKGYSEKKNQNSTYVFEQMNVNGNLCFKEFWVENETDNFINYYVQANGGFFVVEARCGSELKEAMIPIIEYMVKSFEVL